MSNDKVLRDFIITTLRDNPEGMTELALATLISMRREVVAVELADLCRDGDITIERVNSKGQRVFGVTDKGIRGLTDQRYVAKERKCLTCAQMFWSTDAGNRMCEPCKEGSTGTFSDAEKAAA